MRSKASSPKRQTPNKSQSKYSQSSQSSSTRGVAKRKENRLAITQGARTFKVSRKLLREIKRLQLTATLCIPKISFVRVIREVLNEHITRETSLNHGAMRVQRDTLAALQEAAEIYITALFEDSNMCAAHANRITIKPVDMKLALRLRGGLMSDAILD